jgi:DNA-binding NarL/FixJ family response regulator
MVTKESANQQVPGIFPEEITRGMKPKVFRGKTECLLGKALTKRELEVVAALRDCLPSKLIAERLKLSEGSVRVYLDRIYRKTGLTRIELAIREIEKENAALKLQLSKATESKSEIQEHPENGTISL